MTDKKQQHIRIAYENMRVNTYFQFCVVNQ